MLLHRRAHRFGVRDAQPPVQPRQLRRRSRGGIHRCQHRAAQRGRVGKCLVRQQLEGWTRNALRRPGAIRTMATSMPSAEVPLMMPATFMACALMKFPPERWCAGRLLGLAAVPTTLSRKRADLVAQFLELLGGERGRDLPLIQSRPLPRGLPRACQQKIAEGRRLFCRGEQRVIGAQNKLGAVADLHQIRARADGLDRRFVHGQELQNASHLQIIGKDHAPIPDALAQDRGDPELRGAGRHVLPRCRRIGRMIGHDDGHLLDEARGTAPGLRPKPAARCDEFPG